MVHPTLGRYLVMQRALDTDILRALQVAATSVEAELRRLQSSQRVGALMRTQQLLLSEQAIQAELGRYWSRAGEITKAAMAEGAALGAETMLDHDLLGRVFGADDVDYLTRSARASAEQALRTASERISGTSYIPLAESVYDNAALSSGKIDDLVNSAIIRGASAAELAADVRDFVNPNTPGGARYASMRLARTELNNAFHASQIRQAQKDPWTLTVKWHLSGSHPRPDECNEYADSSHFPGGEAGHFRPGEVPAKPHPNCLCFTTPENDDVDEFIRKFEAGEYDDYLDETYPGIGSYHQPSSSKAARRGTSWYDKAYPKALSDRDLLDRAQDNVRSLGMKRSDFEGLPDDIIDDLMSGAPEGLERALAGWRAYTGGNYRTMNRALRDGVGVEDARAMNEAFDEFFDTVYAQTMSEDTVVWRGLRTFDEFDPSDVRVGQFMSDPGWASATAREETARGFGDWVLEIVMPEGSRYAPGTDYEKELVLRKGSIIRITGRDEKTKTLYGELVGK